MQIGTITVRENKSISEQTIDLLSFELAVIMSKC
jgi:hypothetical protein